MGNIPNSKLQQKGSLTPLQQYKQYEQMFTEFMSSLYYYTNNLKIEIFKQNENETNTPKNVIIENDEVTVNMETLSNDLVDNKKFANVCRPKFSMFLLFKY